MTPDDNPYTGTQYEALSPQLLALAHSMADYVDAARTAESYVQALVAVQEMLSLFPKPDLRFIAGARYDIQTLTERKSNYE
jgi:hypothetical protein